MTLKVENRVPTAAEFIALRVETDWGVPDRQTTQAALNASLCGAVGIRHGQTIAMVRAVGDGILNIYVQDVIVAKGARSDGVGKALLRSFLLQLSETYPATCTIGLFAAEGQSAFYDVFGFTSRPSVGFGPGMHATLSNLTQAALAKADNAA